jgi:hypothetical protein
MHVQVAASHAGALPGWSAQSFPTFFVCDKTSATSEIDGKVDA